MSGRALTPPQTVGPFFHIMLREPMNALATPQTAGTRIRIEGFVYDGDRAVVPDAMVEIWQANAAGRYRHPADLRPAPLDPAFVGFGRCGTDERGFYSFDTIKPGPVPFDAQRVQAPHISMLVFARGLLDHLRTRAYFDDERRMPTTRCCTWSHSRGAQRCWLSIAPTRAGSCTGSTSSCRATEKPSFLISN